MKTNDKKPPADVSPNTGDGTGELTIPGRQDGNPLDDKTLALETAKPTVPESGSEQTGMKTSDEKTPEKKTMVAGKQRIYHPRLKGKQVIVGSVLVTFDLEGYAELDTEQAAYLLTIPGYTMPEQEEG